MCKQNKCACRGDFHYSSSNGDTQVSDLMFYVYTVKESYILYRGGLYLGMMFSFKSEVLLMRLGLREEGAEEGEEEDLGEMLERGGSARRLLTLFCSCANSAVLTLSLFSRAITSCT